MRVPIKKIKALGKLQTVTWQQLIGIIVFYCFYILSITCICYGIYGIYANAAWIAFGAFLYFDLSGLLNKLRK